MRPVSVPLPPVAPVADIDPPADCVPEETVTLGPVPPRGGLKHQTY